MMKRYLLSTLGAFTLALAANAQVRWLQTEQDLGAFSEDLGAVDAVFKMVNESDKPVRILEARATCGCTQPEVPRGDIAPGDTARVVVTYLASGRPGRFSKNIYVRTSADRSKQQTLTISGTVIGASATLASRYPVSAGPLKMRSSSAGFGEVLRGKLKTVFIEVYNQSTDTVCPSVSDMPGFINCTITPSAVPPGQQAQLALTLQTLDVPDWGITNGRFTFTPAPGETPVEVDYFMIVSEDFSQLTPGQRLNAPIVSLSPERIDLGQVAPDSVHHCELTVKNTGKSPLLVRRLQVVDEAITSATISSDKIKSGKIAVIKLTVDPSKARNDFINARVTLITNDPDNPLLVGRVTAEITPVP